jgi:DNA invertase Pin-like site-specific DNA recombinase
MARNTRRKWTASSQKSIVKLFSDNVRSEMSYGVYMLIGYARVSTDTQDHSLQIDALIKAGCEKIFEETGSGTKADRPVLAEALQFARSGDVLVIYSLSRLARSIRHLLDIADDLQRREIGLRSVTEALDTSSPGGKFVFTIMGALSEMEVQLLRERTRAGLAAARARGRRGGRPRALDPVKMQVARTLLAAGHLTVGEVAAQVGVAPSTIYRSLPGGRRAVFTSAS